MEWISLKDELPEFGKAVLVHFKNKIPRIKISCFFARESKRNVFVVPYSGGVEEEFTESITHWASLSEPPNEKSEPKPSAFVGEPQFGDKDKSAIQILADISGELENTIDDSEPCYIHQGHILKAMQEYATQERNKAVQNCIDIAAKEVESTDDHAAYVHCDNIISKLEQLKQ